MKIEHKKVNFQDARGTIVDIVQDVPFEHATTIFTNKGGVRGNHYHKESIQYLFVASGKLRTVSQKVGDASAAAAAPEEVVLEKYDLVIHDPMEAHAYEALEDTIFLVLTRGPRGGTNYEEDTFRLQEPLIASGSK